VAGLVVPIIPSRLLDFGTLANVGSSMELVLQQSIDVTRWRTANLLVRVLTTDLAGGTLQFNVYCEGLTPDDPGLSFATLRGPLFTLSSTTPQPSFLVGTLNPPLGSALRVSVLATRTQAGNIRATVAAEFCLKNA
jgi:hypothetical protein